MALILRTDLRYIPAEWLVRPDFLHWPPKKNRAKLWFLANFTAYRLQKGHAQTLEDLYDFLRRSKWKMAQRVVLDKCVGNYLSVIDWPIFWPK
jgi:hypothetical protein